MFDWFWSALLKFFDWIPLPDFLGRGFNDIVGLIPGQYLEVAKYFIYLSGLDVLIPAVLTAHVARFLLRRIPFIG